MARRNKAERCDWCGAKAETVSVHVASPTPTGNDNYPYSGGIIVDHVCEGCWETYEAAYDAMHAAAV